MSQAGITLIIVGITCVLYVIEKLPVALVTVLGMLAMVFAGSVSFKDAFSNFGSTPAMLVFGMVIIIDAIIDSGVITEFENVLMKMTRHGEKTFLILILLSAGVISVFSNNTALVAMFMPFIASVAETTHGRIQKKHIYLPLAVGGLIGGTGSLAGSTAPLLASEVLKITGQKQFAFFTTAPVAMTILLVVALCYWLFLYDLQVKWFDFPETANEKPERPPSTLEPMIDMDEDLAVIRALGDEQVIPVDRKHGTFAICVFLLCVVLFITRPFEWDLGLIAVSGSVTLGAALGIADGFVKSGAGDLVIGFLVNTFGPAMTDPKVMVALFLVSGWIISNFMSNGSLVSMLASVAVPMAIEYGINPEPVAIACCIGASMAFATPVATTTVTMVQIAGYRFKDYLRVGGLIGLIGVVAAWTVIVLMYGLY